MAKGLWLLIGLAAALWASYYASSKWLTSASTQLLIPNAKLNLGVIEFGSSAEGTFLLIPTGSHPLVIEAVGADCGCLVVDWPQTPVAVGDTAFLKVRYNRTTQAGFFQQLVEVRANIPEQSRILMLSGTVLPDS